MTWLLYSLLTAFFESLKDVASKQGLKILDEYIVACISMTIAVFCLLPVVLWDGIPTLKPAFIWALLSGGTLNVVAFILYIRALKIADLSLTVPLVTLTPLFMLVTSPLIVQEYPTWADGLGCLLLIVGAYVLNLKERRQGEAQESVWAPLLRLLTNSGSRLMLGVAFIWSITSNIDKVGVLNSSPLMWAMSLFGFIALGIWPIVLRRFWGVWQGQSHGRGQGQHLNLSKVLYLLWPHLKILGLAGLCNALAVGFQMVAVAMVPVTQVIALKRMSSLFSVVLGSLIFREQGLQERLLGAAIMVSGVVVINLL